MNYLIILDIDYTITGYQVTNMPLPIPEQEKPDVILEDPQTLGFSVEKQMKIWVYKRPGLDQLLDFCFSEGISVGIWTAAEEAWKDYILDTILRPYKDRFLFSWSKNETVNKTVQGLTRMMKPLSKVWSVYPQFNKKNTLLIDDYENITDDISCQLRIEMYMHGTIDTELLKILAGLRILVSRSKGKVIDIKTLISAYNNIRNVVIKVQEF